jgi:hypothetical protein
MKALKIERPRLCEARAVVLMKLRTIVDARLSQPSLIALAVTEAAPVTVRYANKVPAEYNTSIMRLVRRNDWSVADRPLKTTRRHVVP